MQRVSIGRALGAQPDIYLMDEPLSSLDAKLRSDLRVELKRIQADLGATMLYVTHDQIEAMTMATQVGVLDAGRLVQSATPARDLREPGQPLRRRPLGLPRINALPADLFGARRPGPRRSACGRSTSARAKAGPQRSCASSILGIRPGCISLDGHDIVTLTDVHTALRAGDTVAINRAARSISTPTAPGSRVCKEAP